MLQMTRILDKMNDSAADGGISGETGTFNAANGGEQRRNPVVISCSRVILSLLLALPRLKIFIVLAGLLSAAEGIASGTTRFDLRKTFDLGGPQTPGIRHYLQETRVMHFGLDGKPTGTETYRMKLEWTSSSKAGGTGDGFRCRRLTLQKDAGPEVTVPSLENWSYEFHRTLTGLDDKGQIFGIDHAKFQNLQDADGRILMPATAYAVYNAFIDFHSFTEIFAKPTDEGGGIQDLKNIGDKIVHASAFSEPPVNLGNLILPGSTFKNGEVTLEFKGLGIHDGAACALIGFDSGESAFRMIMKPMPDMEIQAFGRSHYCGDLYLELESRWVRRVDLTETVITEVNLPTSQKKINEVIERKLLIRTLTREEFEKE